MTSRATRALHSEGWIHGRCPPRPRFGGKRPKWSGAACTRSDRSFDAYAVFSAPDRTDHALRAVAGRIVFASSALSRASRTSISSRVRLATAFGPRRGRRPRSGVPDDPPMVLAAAPDRGHGLFDASGVFPYRPI